MPGSFFFLTETSAFAFLTAAPGPNATHAEREACVDDMCREVSALLQKAAEFGGKLATARKTLEVTKSSLAKLRCE